MLLIAEKKTGLSSRVFLLPVLLSACSTQRGTLWSTRRFGASISVSGTCLLCPPSSACSRSARDAVFARRWLLPVFPFLLFRGLPMPAAVPSEVFPPPASSAYFLKGALPSEPAMTYHEERTALPSKWLPSTAVPWGPEEGGSFPSSISCGFVFSRSRPTARRESIFLILSCLTTLLGAGLDRGRSYPCNSCSTACRLSSSVFLACAWCALRPPEARIFQRIATDFRRPTVRKLVL